MTSSFTWEVLQLIACSRIVFIDLTKTKTIKQMIKRNIININKQLQKYHKPRL